MWCWPPAPAVQRHPAAELFCQAAPQRWTALYDFFTTHLPLPYVLPLLIWHERITALAQGKAMKDAALHAGIILLEVLFTVGIIGSAIIVVLVAIDDFKEVFEKDQTPH